MKLVFFALLAMLPFSGMAQMYKCVDERGVTGYSDKPRPGCKGSQVDIRPSAPISGEIRPRGEDFASDEADFKRRQHERERAQSKDRAALAGRCRSLRREHARLSTGRRLLEVNANGERVYLPDDVRSQRLTQITAALRGCP